ncbi:MAG: hypothetical protein PHH60_05905 [Candidatus Margulisbacteria bacterium]|nr:hypothetical protein [Candidatus Margulisiibacteriota bacterium]
MKALLALGLWCWVLGTMAFGLELSGYYENDVLGLLKKDWSTGAGDLNRLRLKLDHQLNNNVAIHLEPRYYFLLKTNDLPLEGVSSLDKLTWDRYYAKAKLPAFSITAGKQRIAWGCGYIWNPTDIFNPFVLSFAVKEEDESNVESVRLEVPVGEAGGVDAFVLTGKPWEQTGRGLRVKGNVGLFDLSGSYVDQGTLGHQIGFDATGDILKDIGARGEIAFKTSASGEAYIQSVLGCDYTLDNGIGLNLEYYFNGLGNKDKHNYNWTTGQLGMDYLFLSANKIIDELTTVTVSLLTNLNDGGFMIYPQYARSLSQNLDLNLEGMVLGGPDSSEFVPPPAVDIYGFGGCKMILIRLVYNF